MKLDVVGNAKKNLIFGAINKGIILILPFIVRAVINTKLSSEYLGLNSLFSSILTVLNLSELGFSSAIVYHMYQPAAENDTYRICALLNLYRKIYAIVGTIVLALGLAMIPLLPYFVNGPYPKEINLTGIYLIFLADTVISYFMYAYLSSLITVYQRNDRNSMINTVISVALNCAKIIVILLFRDYYLCILLQPLFTILNNLWIALVVRKLFPQYRCYGTVPRETLSSIKVLVTGAFIQKVCTVTRNSLDSICISSFLGLALTGIYNNYYTISASISSFLGLFYSSFIGGVGNHIAIKNKSDNFDEMKKLDFMYLWLSGWCTICLLCLFQPFMTLWMGESMLLDMKSVTLFCIYFYLLKLGDVRYIYTEARGLWWEHRYRSVVEAIGNFLLNVVFGRLWGIYGILTATILTIFFINYLWGSQITFWSYFGIEKRKEYFRYQLEYTIVNLVICIVTFLLASFIDMESVWTVLLLRMCLCALFPNILYLIVYHRKAEFRDVLALLKRI